MGLASIRGSPKSPLCPPLCENTQRCLQPGRGPGPPCWHPDLGLPASRAVRDEPRMFMSPAAVVFYSSQVVEPRHCRSQSWLGVPGASQHTLRRAEVTVPHTWGALTGCLLSYTGARPASSPPPTPTPKTQQGLLHVRVAMGTLAWT